MINFFCKDGVLLVAFFFMIHFHAEAVLDNPGSKMVMGPLEDLGQGGSFGIKKIVNFLGGFKIGNSGLLQKMKFEILIQAHKEMLYEKYLDFNRFEKFKIANSDSFADVSMEKALEAVKENLYSWPENIKEWQILQKAADISLEKIKKEQESSQERIHTLKVLHDIMLKDYDEALCKRKFFLEESLKIATEIDMWIAFYHMHKPCIHLRCFTMTEEINDLLMNKAKISKCGDLYQSKDSIQNSLALDMKECKDFLLDIANALRPFYESKRDPIPIWSFYMMDFLEKIKEKFSDLNKLQHSFNIDDGKILFKAIEGLMNFYSEQTKRIVDQFLPKAMRLSKQKEAAVAALQSNVTVASLREEEEYSKMLIAEAKREKINAQMLEEKAEAEAEADIMFDILTAEYAANKKTTQAMVRRCAADAALEKKEVSIEAALGKKEKNLTIQPAGGVMSQVHIPHQFIDQEAGLVEQDAKILTAEEVLEEVLVEKKIKNLKIKTTEELAAIKRRAQMVERGVIVHDMVATRLEIEAEAKKPPRQIAPEARIVVEIKKRRVKRLTEQLAELKLMEKSELLEKVTEVEEELEAASRKLDSAITAAVLTTRSKAAIAREEAVRKAKQARLSAEEAKIDGAKFKLQAEEKEAALRVAAEEQLKVLKAEAAKARWNASMAEGQRKKY